MLTFVVVQYIVATSDHNLVSINSCSNFCCVSLGSVNDLSCFTLDKSKATVSVRPFLFLVSTPFIARRVKHHVIDDWRNSGILNAKIIGLTKELEY